QASGSSSHQKRALELHRKDHSHHKQASGSRNHEKRAVADKNIDTELAFHRSISRNRKTQNLGQMKNKRATEPLIKSQDIKESSQKQNKQPKD
ncbi:hypothetical protein CPC16_008522, partial [Podila verticillata]